MKAKRKLYDATDAERNAGGGFQSRILLTTYGTSVLTVNGDQAELVRIAGRAVAAALNKAAGD